MPTMDLRVGLDGRPAIRPNPTGIGRYVRDLLASLGPGRDQQRYTSLLDGCRRRDSKEHLPGDVRASHQLFQRNGMRVVWEEVWLPRTIQRLNLDVYHGTTGLLPLFLPDSVAAVITVYDVVQRLFPETLDFMHRRRLEMGFRHALRRADGIISISRSTARDIARCYGVPLERIDIVSLGVVDTFRPMTEPGQRRSVLQRYGIHEPFVLYVGSLGPRKNLPTLIAAFARLRAIEPSEIQLVLAGPPDGAGALLDHARKAGIAGSVLFPGYVTDADLPVLYSAAAAAAWPSLYEGFGYPVLEAMSCGAPVVCSHSSSLPEVVGSAGLLAPPLDVDAWAQTLATVFRAPHKAASLRSASQRQAARFSLDREVAATAAVYVRAAERAAFRRHGGAPRSDH